LFICQFFEVRLFGYELAEQLVVVLDCSFLLRGVGVCEEYGGVQPLGDVFVLGELSSVVGRDGVLAVHIRGEQPHDGLGQLFCVLPRRQQLAIEKWLM